MHRTHLANHRDLLGAAFAGVLLLTLFTLTAPAQVKLAIDRRVRVHQAPSLTSKRIDGLTPGSKVTLLKGRRGDFFKVQLENEKTGWVHGKYLFLPDLEERPLGAESMMTEALASSFPLCGPEAHYRWKQKISTSGFTQQPGSPTLDQAAQAGLRLVLLGRRLDVVLAAPHRRNAQTPASWRALAAIGQEAAEIADVVVVRADGPSFSAGLDRR